MPDHYDPNQPRVPKGHSNGGEWTRGSHGEFQPIRFAPTRGLNGSKPSEVQHAFLPAAAPVIAPAIEKSIELALMLLALGAARSASGTQRVGVYRLAGDTNTEADLKSEGVQQPTNREVRDYCPYHKKVVEKANSAASNVNQALRISREDISAAVYGTRVHHELAEAIENDRKKPSKVGVEASIAKARLETGIEATKAVEDAHDYNRYGKKGTVRFDVVEWGKDRTLCIYDLKTGAAEFTERTMQKYLDYAMARLAELNSYIRRPDVKPKRVFLIEVKPDVARPNLNAR